MFLFGKKVTFHKVTNVIAKCKDHSKDIKQKKKSYVLAMPVYVK